MKICIACDARFNSSNWCCPVCGFTPHALEGYLCFSPELARVNDGFRAESFRDLFVYWKTKTFGLHHVTA